MRPLMLLCLLVMLPSQTRAQAPVDISVAATPPPTAYDELLDEAVGQFAEGNWVEARALFFRAHALSPSARTLRGMGMADFNLSAYVRAVAELEASLASTVNPLDQGLREQVQALLGRAARFVARYTLLLTPADATVTVDGGAPTLDGEGNVLLELGPHEIVASKAGFDTATVRVQVHDSERRIIALSARPAVSAPVDTGARDKTRHPWTWGLGTASLATLGGAGVSWLVADALFRDAQADCKARGACFADDLETAGVKRMDRTAQSLLLVGSSLLVAAVVSYFVVDRRSQGGRATPIDSSARLEAPP